MLSKKAGELLTIWTGKKQNLDLETSWYSQKKTKPKNFAQEIKTIYQTKIIKRSYTSKTYEQTYIVEILHSFNPASVLQNTKCALVKNRLKILLNEWRGLKFWKPLWKNLKNREW